MSKPRNEQVAAMRAVNRRLSVEALRDGRRQRAAVIPSGKVYRRQVGKRIESS